MPGKGESSLIKLWHIYGHPSAVRGGGEKDGISLKENKKKKKDLKGNGQNVEIVGSGDFPTLVLGSMISTHSGAAWDMLPLTRPSSPRDS